MFIPRLAALILAVAAADAGVADDGDLAKSETPLHEIQKVSLPTLAAATSVTVSPDGRFLYAAAFSRSYLNIFKRDPATGLIELQDSITSPDLKAVVMFRLSRDGIYGIASAFRANAITLFKRDPITGSLTILDAALSTDQEDTGLGFVIDALFSRDGRHVYTASSTGIGVFKIEGEKLHFVEKQPADDQLTGLRGIELSPDGQTLYVAATHSSSIGVLRVDAAAGTLQLLEIIKDGEGEAQALGGVFRMACSADGKHVYASSGRFGGDSAVTVFESQADGKLKLVEEHVNGAGSLTGYEGGNQLAVSPDGTLLVAGATLSDTLVSFRRDLESGKLTFISSQDAGEKMEPGAPGLCFSPDGRFVYVADEATSAILSYRVR
jgi:6-phosphogluconolactonase (cycloisomerase 2 family)